MTTKRKYPENRKGVSIFLDENKRLGHMYIAEELLKELKSLAESLNMTRTGLMRRALEALVLYYQDARSFKKPTMFGKKPSLQTWLMEREDVHIMTEKVEELAKQMDIAKTPDEKLILLSKQNLITSHMINLLHKTTMT
tara:strand:- start:96 stop:512 length:417 start_codon:yes stop_codon:yes gene_type:complete